MTIPDSNRSDQPEAEFSDWFGVEIKRPANAPTPDATRPEADSAIGSDRYPGSSSMSSSYPTRSASTPTGLGDGESNPSNRSASLVVGAALTVAGLGIFFVLLAHDLFAFGALALAGGGLISIFKGLTDT